MNLLVHVIFTIFPLIFSLILKITKFIGHIFYFMEVILKEISRL